MEKAAVSSIFLQLKVKIEFEKIIEFALQMQLEPFKHFMRRESEKHMF